jgi:diguanylate cyclase (GGDEF)-like protein
MPNQGYTYPRPPLTLIVTRHEWVSLSVETILAPRGYAVLRAFSGQQALRRLVEAPPDLLLVERDLGDMSATDFCNELREGSVVPPTTPICVIGTSSWPRSEKLDALRAGAWDVCSLPMDGEELFLRLDAWVRAKLAADSVREQGLLDPDTGLYNAQGLLRRLAELSAGAARYARPIGCVILSSDAGVALAGSAAATWTAATARTVAATLQSARRGSDTIGRLSGTEFVIVAPDTDPAGVLGLARRLQAAVESHEEELGSLRLRFGCYAVPNLDSEAIAPTELLIRAADALRRAHSEGEPIRIFEEPSSAARRN